MLNKLKKGNLHWEWGVTDECWYDALLIMEGY